MLEHLRFQGKINKKKRKALYISKNAFAINQG